MLQAFLCEAGGDADAGVDPEGGYAGEFAEREEDGVKADVDIENFGVDFGGGEHIVPTGRRGCEFDAFG